MQGKLVLAPANLKPTWCWKFSGLVWFVIVLLKLGLVLWTLTALWKLLHGLETDLQGCPPSLHMGDDWFSRIWEVKVWEGARKHGDHFLKKTCSAASGEGWGDDGENTLCSYCRSHMVKPGPLILRQPQALNIVTPSWGGTSLPLCCIALALVSLIIRDTGLYNP